MDHLGDVVDGIPDLGLVARRLSSLPMIRGAARVILVFQHLGFDGRELLRDRSGIIISKSVTLGSYFNSPWPLEAVGASAIQDLLTSLTAIVSAPSPKVLAP